MKGCNVRIAFDIHGVIDTYPKILKPMISMLKATGQDVVIVSGPKSDEIWREMVKLGISGVPYYSVVDFLENQGVEFTYDSKSTPWCDEETWWDSKARICQHYDIDYLIDDSYKYEPAFKLIDAEFIHISEIMEVR